MARTEKKINLFPFQWEKTFFLKEKFLLAASFFLPLTLFLILRMRCIAIQGGEGGTDCFYHAAMAMRGTEIITAKKFPFLAFSLWQETFADKELLYHLLLQLIFHIQEFFTGAVYPFTFPVMIFSATALLSFLTLLKFLKIPAKIIFLSSILFSFSSFVFLYRFLVLRPHVFSLAFLLGACSLFLIRNFAGKCAVFFLLAFLYSWSYSNPHFLLLPVLLYIYFARKEYSLKGVFLPCAVLAGLITGYLIHPQVPNTFVIWKVQSLDAVLTPLFYGRQLSAKLTPMEMMPGDFSWYRHALPLYILSYFSLYLFIRLQEKAKKSGETFFTAVEKTIFTLAVLFVAGTFFVLRTIEYAQPFAVAAFAILLSRSQREKCGFFTWKMPSVRVYSFLFLAAVIFFAATIPLFLNSNFQKKPPRDMVEFLKKNTPKNSLIVNIDWGDFPPMFYANDHNILLWGMDPAFSYAVNPRKARNLENCVISATSRSGIQHYFRMFTGADYAFLLAGREKYTGYLKRQGWKVLYESKEGCVFSLKDSR